MLAGFSIPSLVTGDVLSATIIDTEISAYLNGALVGTASDGTWSSGTPGFGFDYTGGGNTYGISSFSANDNASTAAGLAQPVIGVTGNGSRTATLAYGSNVTAGNLLVAVLSKFTGGASEVPTQADVSTSAGTATVGTWTMDAEQQVRASPDGYIAVGIWSVPVTGNGSCTVSVALGANGYYILSLYELVSPNVTDSRVDVSAVGSNARTGPEITTSFDTTVPDIIIGAVVNDVDGTRLITLTPQSGYAVGYANADPSTNLTGASVYQVAAEALSGQRPGLTTPSTYGFAACAVAYKQQ